LAVRSEVDCMCVRHVQQSCARTVASAACMRVSPCGWTN
jgi:hypothetical protein